MMANLINRLFAAVNRIVPKDPHRAVFCSFPDMSDNAQALYTYIAAHPSGHSEKLVWLLEDPAAVSLPVGKSVKKHSLRGVWHFWRAGYVFHTHGIFGNVAAPHQINVSLWHGMPLKTIMQLDATHAGAPDFGFTYTIATSPLFQKIMGQAFGCPPQRCLLTGLPRNDLLFDPPPLNELMKDDLPDVDHMVLWMPTYRKSVIGDIREDGTVSQEGIGFLSSEDLARLNTFLADRRLLLIIKVHPMQDMTPFAGMEHSHIRVLSGISGALYPLVGRADALLTDYSSVYIDYMLLDRPIGFVTDDWEAYRDSRGFVFDDPIAMMPGPFITDYHQLTAFLDDVLAGEDSFREQRRALTKRFHTHQDGHSCNRLLHEIHWI